MCFSATSSFMASAILTGVGALAISKTKQRSHYMFAIIPLLFAIQQMSEGVVWLTFGRVEYAMLYKWMIYIFLAFALIVWPMWISISLWIIEKIPILRKYLLALSCIAIVLSLYSLSVLLMNNISANIVSYNIIYNVNLGSIFTKTIYSFFYLLSTVLPFFISSLVYASFLGLAIFVALALVVYFWSISFVISGWCFFSALLSAFVLFIVYKNKDFQKSTQKN